MDRESDFTVYIEIHDNNKVFMYQKQQNTIYPIGSRFCENNFLKLLRLVHSL